MSELAVVLRLSFSDYERYQIAYVNDIVENPNARSYKEWKPRLATREECRKFVNSELSSMGLRLGDLCPNFNSDGTIVRDYITDELDMEAGEDDDD